MVQFGMLALQSINTSDVALLCLGQSARMAKARFERGRRLFGYGGQKHFPMQAQTAFGPIFPGALPRDFFW
jgi:hypothetical protein